MLSVVSAIFASQCKNKSRNEGCLCLYVLIAKIERVATQLHGWAPARQPCSHHARHRKSDCLWTPLLQKWLAVHKASGNSLVKFNRPATSHACDILRTLGVEQTSPEFWEHPRRST